MRSIGCAAGLLLYAMCTLASPVYAQRLEFVAGIEIDPVRLPSAAGHCYYLSVVNGVFSMPAGLMLDGLDATCRDDANFWGGRGLYRRGVLRGTPYLDPSVDRPRRYTWGWVQTDNGTLVVRFHVFVARVSPNPMGEGGECTEPETRSAAGGVDAAPRVLFLLPFLCKIGVVGAVVGLILADVAFHVALIRAGDLPENDGYVITLGPGPIESIGNRKQAIEREINRLLCKYLGYACPSRNDEGVEEGPGIAGAAATDPEDEGVVLLAESSNPELVEAVVASDELRLRFNPTEHGEAVIRLAGTRGGVAIPTVVEFTVTIPPPDPFLPLIPGGTAIRPLHLTEIRDAANEARLNCGLAAAAWTDPTITADVTPVRAVHITELRAALTEAYAACASLPPPRYVDDPLRAGMPIKAQHFTELRTAVDAIRNSASRAK